MRTYFCILFFICLFCQKAWAQPKAYPLAWDETRMQNARIQETTPYTTTLKLPYFYDFSSIYLQIDSIVKGSTVNVYSARPHGLISKDTVVISGAKAPTVVGDFTGLKYVKRISDYQFELYNLNDTSYATPASSTEDIDYLRISKLGAKVSNIPDTLAFYYNKGGVQITGGTAKNQISYYTARFDGLNENGTPYSTNSFAVGYTDSLRSHPFDFSGYTTSSNIYMSFHYQQGGYGEQADANDYLYLEFLDNTHNWNIVKEIKGTSRSRDSFYIAMVPVDDAKYFHDAFQYRFRSYGRQSGAYDVWNVDYIYINENRTSLDTTVRDFAIRNGDQTFLKNFTAMPFDHFFRGNHDITTYFQNTIKTTVTNQANYGKPKNVFASIVDQEGNVIATTQTPSDDDFYLDREYVNVLSPASGFPVRKPIYVDLIHGLEDDRRTDVDVATSTGLVDLMYNNILTKRTYLYDYYAYDDSEAEMGFGSNEGGVEFAYEFASQKKDTLTHIDICFTRNKDASLENFQIFLLVWGQTLNSQNELYKHPISIHYPSTPNGFVRYELTNPLVVDSGQKFHIGYAKNFPQLLTVGYDQNKDSRDKSYYKSGSTWFRLDNPAAGADDAGTMMMRPVFYNAANNVPLSNRPSKESSKNALLLYPNPTSSVINIIAQDEISELNYVMYSLFGHVVSSGIVTPTEHTINVSALSSGLYVIICTDAKGITYTTRFIKE